MAYLTGSFQQLKNRISQPVIPFLLAWILPFWILIELVPTKLPHYPFPVYPALLLLVISSVLAEPSPSPTMLSGLWRKTVHIFEVASRTLLISVPFSIGLGIIFVTYYLEGILPWVAIICTFLATLAGAAGVYNWKDRPRSLLCAGLSAYLLFTGVFQFGLAGLSRLWIAPALVAEIERHSECRTPLIFVHGYNEPSFTFLNRHPVHTLAQYERLKASNADCHFFIIENRRAQDFHKTVPKDRQGMLISNAEGYNLSNWKSLNFAIYRFEIVQ